MRLSCAPFSAFMMPKSYYEHLVCYCEECRYGFLAQLAINGKVLRWWILFHVPNWPSRPLFLCTFSVSIGVTLIKLPSGNLCAWSPSNMSNMPYCSWSLFSSRWTSLHNPFEALFIAYLRLHYVHIHLQYTDLNHWLCKTGSLHTTVIVYILLHHLS